MTSEFLGMTVILVGVVTSLSNIYVSIRNQKHADQAAVKSALFADVEREKSLREMMSGYVSQIREYESEISALRDKIDELLDRISWLETVLAQNGISTPVYGRRATDKKPTIPREKLETTKTTN